MIEVPALLGLVYLALWLRKRLYAGTSSALPREPTP